MVRNSSFSSKLINRLSSTDHDECHSNSHGVDNDKTRENVSPAQ